MPQPNQAPLSSDAAIGRRSEDRFGRFRIAERIASEARHAPPQDGFVIALCGAWGSGKTSIGNMAAEIIDGDENSIVVRFNPWMFSGAEDLVGRFFGELAATLGKHDGKLRNVASRVAGYAGALSGAAGFIPGIGGTATSALAATQQVMSAVGEGPALENRRDELVEALLDLDGRIVAFLDDLDRLTDDELREVVRLVKLVGDLPNVTYILSFDRERVEEALGAPEPDPDRARKRGRAYLEKIVQSQHDVPPLRPQTIMRFMGELIEAALEPYDERRWHAHDWTNMLALALRHMVHTPRNAKRVANAVPSAVELYGDEVALVDLLGLEALRVLEPDVHAGLAEVAGILVGDRVVLGNEEAERDRNRAAIGTLVDKARHPEATRRLLGQLFPRAQPALANVRGRSEEQTERRECRVAIASVFRTYLHTTLDDDALAASEVDRLASLLSEPQTLHTAFEELDDRFLDDAIGRLIDYAPSFRPEYAVEAAKVLIALEPRLDQDRSPLFSGKAPSSWQLNWLIGHLLLAEADDDRRSAMAIQLAEEAPDLSTRLRTVNWFGTHPERDDRDSESEMISEEATKQLLNDIRERVRAASTADLVTERMLALLLVGLLYPDADAGRAVIRDKAADDAVMLQLLAYYYGVQQRQALGEAAVRRIPQLHWNSLTELLGEEYLRARVLDLDESQDVTELDEQTRDALHLAVRIARGEVTPDPD